jgi:pyruvate kinase
MSTKSNKKIIATIGPASFAPSIVKAMDRAGVDFFRINLSHTNVEDVEIVYTMLKSWTDKPVCPDTRGVQYRDHPLARVRRFIGYCARPSGLTKKDTEKLKVLNRLGASTVYLSFCSWAEDVAELKSHFDHPITVVSKIENACGLQNLEEICGVSDGILIDRYDLSKDIPLVKIPYAQDYIVEVSLAHSTPVYVATNLMESMMIESLPNRAEANDIVKTLDSGVDGLVLAGETAIGRHPIDAVRVMKEIMDKFDEYPEDVDDLVDWLVDNDNPNG